MSVSLSATRVTTQWLKQPAFGGGYALMIKNWIEYTSHAFELLG